MSRRRSRELALETLYELEVGGGDVAVVLRGLGERAKSSEAGEYAETLVLGVLHHKDDIDARLAEVAANWSLARMAAVDRNVLRLACYEMGWEPEVPPRAAVDEALEVARRYGGEGSVSFVNGILDKVLAQGIGARASEGADEREAQ